ncbi:MAG: tetratricopeptide repeat protein [Pyrinomonadaceae bacterium]
MKLFTPCKRYFAAFCVLLIAAALAVVSQTTKPKPAVKKQASKAKATAAKTPAKKAVSSKSKTKDPKPKTPDVPKPDEKAEWEKAVSMTDAGERIAAVKAFLITFPESEKLIEARSLIVTAYSELGNASLSAGDPATALVDYKMAIADAPAPVPDQLFAETFARFPANLYFRGAREESYELASMLEKVAESNVGQLVSIANFYMSVENGSEARRVADIAIKAAPDSSVAYQTLGLASRMDFRLDMSAAAHARALELDPDSLSARRGLAEMKRATGKSEDAEALYREILGRDEGNVPARTGLILSLFDSGKVSEAEAEMSRSLEENPGNVILLAGAAYWYAAHQNGDKAVSSALSAIASDPRFIWSHIALARGYMARNEPVAAERTLLAARRYGNFPTLEYEIASARATAGFYREATEELAKSFSVKNGVVRTNLGGRVTRESTDLTELIGLERRASIFAPKPADSAENGARLIALLTLKHELSETEPRTSVLAKAADDLIRGDDKMKVHRQIYAAEQLVEKRAALDKVMEITRSAIANVVAGLEVPNPSTAVMASELYEPRRLAAARNDYINVPDVPRQTLSTILRGQIEEIQGWAMFQTDAAEDAIMHLKRAASVLPADSAWWRSTTWRLGTAFASTGKDAEALDMYIRSYKGGQPNIFSYGVIEDIYKRVNGNTVGLEELIGAKPDALGLTPVAKVEATPPVQPIVRPTPRRTPSVVPIEIATPTPEESPKPVERIEVATPSPTPVAEVPSATPTASPTPDEEIPTPSPTPVVEEPLPTATPPIEEKPTPTELPTPTPEVINTEESAKQGDEKPKETPAQKSTTALRTDLFEPVVISIPRPPPVLPKRSPTATPSPTPGLDTVAVTKPTPDPVSVSDAKKPTTDTENERPTPDGRPRVVKGEPRSVAPCTLTVSEEVVSLRAGGGDLAVIVGRSDDEDLDEITATSTTPDSVNVRREPITGVKTRALFILKAIGRPGLYQVTFELPCGKREVSVKVR